MCVNEWTIETEDINRQVIHNAMRESGITGYSLYEKKGCWEGVVENSLSISVINTTLKSIKDNVSKAAKAIKDRNHQECVLVECRQIEIMEV